jgi:MFS family permease
MQIISSAQKRKLSYFSIFFTFLVDNLCWAIVFPIFAPLFLDVHNQIFSTSVSIETRTTILGVFLAIYPFAQFFGSPLLGELGDHWGRKRAFLLSIGLTVFGNLLSGLGIVFGQLYLLFIGRLIAGLFSGNLSLCFATISDLSVDQKSKIKNFSYLSLLGGFAFVSGTYIGGFFSDTTVHPEFSIQLPFWIATALSSVNLLFILFGFTETNTINKNKKYDFLESVHNIQEALRVKRLKLMYLIYFLFVISWNVILQFSPVYIIRYFHFTNSQIGALFASMGLIWAFGSGVINRFLSRKWSALKIFEGSLIFFTICTIAVAIPSSLTGILFVLALSVIAAAIAWPLCNVVISDLATREIQGKILGISQSMQSLAMAVSPIIAGLSDEIVPKMIFYITGAFSLVASLLYFKIKK